MTQLKKQICNKKEKKVCCKSEPPTEKLPKRMNDSSNSSYLPNPLTGECGLSGTGADFILGLSDKLKNKQRNWKNTQNRWRGFRLGRVSLDGAAQEGQAGRQNLVALRWSAHQPVVCHHRCPLWANSWPCEKHLKFILFLT